MGNSEILAYLPSIALLTFASAFGMIRLFRSKVPMYYQLAVCAVWSYTVQLIYSVLIIVCAKQFNTDDNLSFLGIAGMFTFLASSNFGQFNTLVDEGGKRLRPIRFISLLAPLTAAVYYVFICTRYEEVTLRFIILFTVVMIPLAVSSYFNLKFILMKDDGSGFIRGVKPLNIASLAAAIAYMGYILADFEDWTAVKLISSAVVIIPVASIVFCADWGRKQWLK